MYFIGFSSYITPLLFPLFAIHLISPPITIIYPLYYHIFNFPFHLFFPGAILSFFNKTLALSKRGIVSEFRQSSTSDEAQSNDICQFKQNRYSNISERFNGKRGIAITSSIIGSCLRRQRNSANSCSVNVYKSEFSFRFVALRF